MSRISALICPLCKTVVSYAFILGILASASATEPPMPVPSPSDLLGQENASDSSATDWLSRGLGAIEREEHLKSQIESRLDEPYGELDGPISIRELCTSLSTRLDVAVFVDEIAMDAAGISLDDSMAFPSSINMRDLMDLMQQQLDVCFVVKGQVLVLSTADQMTVREVRFYDLEKFNLSTNGMDNLMEVIMSIVTAEWDTGDDTIHPFGQTFIINASAKTHKEIEILFARLAQLPPSSYESLTNVRAPSEQINVAAP